MPSGPRDTIAVPCHEMVRGATLSLSLSLAHRLVRHETDYVIMN